jgi:thiosulfate/3-mercaptopyruvate sulfurtransferase
MSEYAHPEVLVDTQWLLEHLHDLTVRVVEVNMSPASFQDAHIPGAVCWNIFTDLLNPDLSQNLDPAAIAKLLARSGISPTTTVIAYGSYADIGAWIFWVLKTIGHDQVYVLNGGYQKWVAEGRPLGSEFSSFPPTEYPTRSSEVSLRVLQPEVQSSLDRALLLDVRTPPEYQGEIFMMKPPVGEERGGHISGAINIENILALNEDGTFKSIEALDTLYGSQGITADQEVFTYCAIGARSACTWFVLKYLLGYPRVRNYDGSWHQWSKMPNVLIVSTASQF